MNETHTKVYQSLIDTPKRFVLCYGGTGSGKSYAAAQKEVNIAGEAYDVKILVIRKVATTLRDSVVPSFRSRIYEAGLSEKFKENKSDRIITNTETGSQIIFRGLDDPDKLKSFEGLQRILVEEAAELDFEDFLELNRRARGRKDIQITLCFNPVHEHHWLKKHFFDKEVDDVEKIHSTYRENFFLTTEDSKQIDDLKRYDHNQYRVYALGEWGLSENNAPWLPAFSRGKHLRPELPFLPKFDVYLSFDFNRDPVTCVATQMSPNPHGAGAFIHFIREFSGNVQLSDLCLRIRSAFPASFLYVTGDASGSQGNIGFDSRHATYYKMIQRHLALPDKQMCINRRNLQHNDSRLLINTIFADHPSVLISQEGCPGLANDCIIAQVDDSSHKPGMLKKDRGIFKMDLFDAMRYFFQAWFIDYSKHVPIKLQKAD